MSQRKDIHKVLIIGSGPIIIGQACEFDYSGTQACKALRKLGYEIVLVNSNPATIMTDPEMADVTYIEPLNVKRLEAIIDKERPDALLPNLGGQSGLNLCSELAEAGVLDKYNVKVIGVQVDAIERGEVTLKQNELGISVDDLLLVAFATGDKDLQHVKHPLVVFPKFRDSSPQIFLAEQVVEGIQLDFNAGYVGLHFRKVRPITQRGVGF